MVRRHLMDNKGSRYEFESQRSNVTVIDGQNGFKIWSACAGVCHRVLTVADAPVCGTARDVGSGVVANLQKIMSIQKTCFRKAGNVGCDGKYLMSSHPNRTEQMCSGKAGGFVLNFIFTDLRCCDENW
jgi:hypothetical protein